MLKSLLLPLFCLSPLLLTSPLKQDETSALNNEFIVDNQTLTGVNEDFKNNTELRIFYDEDTPITVIKSGAFDGCTKLESLTISFSVTSIEGPLFSEGKTPSCFKNIYFTGSQKEWGDLNFTPTEGVEVTHEVLAEGFIHYWDTKIRPEKDSSICNLNPDKTQHIMDLYNSLDNDEKNIVLEYVDKADKKMSDSLKYLINKANGGPLSSLNIKETSSETMISFILLIAVIGMTFIGVFYYLMDVKIIK